MNVHLPFLGMGSSGWTAFDAADGSVCAVSVRTARYPSAKPQVVQFAVSEGDGDMDFALADLATKLGKPAFPCTFALARGDYQMLVMPEPPVLEAEMLSNLRWSLTSMLDYSIEDANIAWIRIPTAEFQPTREKQLYAIVGRNTVVAEWSKRFDKAHLRLSTVDVRETALRNLASLIEKKAEGLGLLTVGPSGISTTFTFRGELYLDRFISQSMDEIIEGDAERRQKFFDRVAQQVYQSMELLTRTHPFIAVDRIVMGPVPGNLQLGAHLAGKLPVPVQLLDLASIFDLSAVPKLLDTDNQARCLVALGAALRGIRKTS